jgi:type VI secretion system secreted protein Hcp
MRWCRASFVARSVLSAAFFAASGLPAAATYAWLDFGGTIPGESTDKTHRDWIEIQSSGFDARREISSSPGGARESSRPQIAEITLTKRLDRASPALFAAAAAGKEPYPLVKLDLNAASTRPIARVELENVLVSGQTFAAAADGSDRPTETITLNFTKITYTYLLPDSPDTLYTSYDLETGAVESNAGQVTPPNPDSDNDGMLDSWELANGLSVGANDAGGDADGDGLSNLDEFQLGTNPKSGTSFFKATLAGVPATPGSYQLTWNSVVGKAYVIERTATLATPFSTLRTVTATSTTSTETVTNAGTMGFYRVRPQ